MTRYNIYDTPTRTRGYQYFTCLGSREELIALMGDFAVVVQSPNLAATEEYEDVVTAREKKCNFWVAF